MSKEAFMSVPQAAELLGCSDVWVLKMLKRGDLQGFRLSGRAWAVSTESVERNLREYMQRDRTHAGRPRAGIG